MHATSPEPNCRELLVAAAAGALCALAGLALAARGDERAACRVRNHLPGGAVNVGSGTLIDVRGDGACGLVLTCAHLFTEGCGQTVVEFADRRTHGANLVAIDRDADLAALEIARPTVAPAPLAAAEASPRVLTACGFGPAGQFRCVSGPVLGVAERPGQSSLRLAGAVRSGDSGGGAFDEQGRLAGVVWGAADGVTYISAGRPLRQFLQRVLGSRGGGGAVHDPWLAAPAPSPSPAPCPEGRCPLAPSARPPALAAPPAVERPAEPFDAATPPRGEPEVGSAAEPGSAALPAWSLVAAAALAGAIAGRWTRRRGASPAKEATAAAEAPFPDGLLHVQTAAPVDRDDREARQLLRLSQLEGRDPLQDALAGRLALDRLDALADGDADPLQAGWADRLRRELRERFNDVAPTKFEVRAQS